MKICRFNNNKLGLLDGTTIIDVSSALDTLPPLNWPCPMGDHLIRNWKTIQKSAKDKAENGDRYELENVKLLSPVANPSKIIGIAGNRKNRDLEKLDFGPGVPVCSETWQLTVSFDPKQAGSPWRSLIQGHQRRRWPPC